MCQQMLNTDEIAMSYYDPAFASELEQFALAFPGNICVNIVACQMSVFENVGQKYPNILKCCWGNMDKKERCGGQKYGLGISLTLNIKSVVFRFRQGNFLIWQIL